MIDTSSQNLATQSRWLAIMPINQIFPNEQKALSLNLTKFTLPEVDMGTTEVKYLGNTVEVPTKIIQPASKTLQFDYIMSSDFYQYRMLHRWVQFVAYNKTINVPQEVVERAQTIQSYAIPITVVLLSEFKSPIIAVRYASCWIKQFGALSMDYQSNDEPVLHQFTVAYSNYEFIDPKDPSIIL